MTGTLTPAYGRPDLARVAALPASWYVSQPVPPALIRNLARAPLVPEWVVDSACETSVYGDGKPSFRLAEVAACAAMGLTEQETAAELFLSPHTVATHRRRLIHAMRARNVTQAVAAAISLGCIRGVRSDG